MLLECERKALGSTMPGCSSVLKILTALLCEGEIEEEE